MVTFFTIPKPFTDRHTSAIQQNAIRSWLASCSRREVILYGDDPGVDSAAAELGVRHVADVQRTEHGTPLLDSVFAHAQKHARFEAVCYLNSDIIVLTDLAAVARDFGTGTFLVAGQRWNLDVREAIDFTSPTWARDVWRTVREKGTLYSPNGIDYFLFPRGCFAEIPPFAVGRPGWDNWLIYHARSRGVPVVDASRTIRVVHQNHDYRHVPLARDSLSWEGPEADHNRALVGDLHRLFTLHHATHVLLGRSKLPALFPPYLPYRLRAFSVLHPAAAPMVRPIQRAVTNLRTLVQRGIE